MSKNEQQKYKHTTVGIRWWSPTQLLIHRSQACVWQSGRDAQFSVSCHRFCCQDHHQNRPLLSAFRFRVPALRPLLLLLSLQLGTSISTFDDRRNGLRALKNAKRLVDFRNLPRASRMAASCVFDHDSGFLETRNCWSISEVCLGPSKRPHPLSGIMTTASWKRGMVGWLQKSAWGLSNGCILCMRSRQWLPGNAKLLVEF